MLSLEIEIVKLHAITKCFIGKKIMTQQDWRVFKKQKGYIYIAYQIGFSQY